MSSMASTSSSRDARMMTGAASAAGKPAVVESEAVESEEMEPDVIGHSRTT